MSENIETAILAGGCFWPAQQLLRHRVWGHLYPRRLHRRGERQPDRRQPSGSRRGGRGHLRSRADLLPEHPGVLLPDPPARPWRRSCRLRLPLRDLLYQRRAAPGRRGHDRRRRRLGHVARHGRDQDQPGRPLLGGRGRRPGLPPALQRRQQSVQHVSIPCAIAAVDEEEPPRSSGDALLLWPRIRGCPWSPPPMLEPRPEPGRRSGGCRPVGARLG